MSVILMSCKKNLANRDMSKKKKIIRKAGKLAQDGIAKLTTARDNLHVWIDGEPVETTAYISDKGYDVDMFFDIEGHSGHIFSDVDNDRDEMVNSLNINDNCVAKCYQKAH
ncbi:uncharacterized protein LOC133180147 isoform X2 [Saccostrea echinata]|uniref:uncharacterized protein LOC133180147 isoform X2 n=1 Tax=Saccostrea echinata TaxID=191078 RepID=UPI002A7EF86C|nr:uncharacterized protein LOC133180147 isoform X2 [Saccostrea echinata]